MIRFPFKTPRLIKRLFPNYVWDFSSSNKTIYLTFDDGPTAEITDWILNTLNEYQAKATFFCIGENITKHPEVFQKILSEGHAIGNHTQNHLLGWKTSKKTYLNNTLEAEQIINKNSNSLEAQTTKLFRPPYGKIKPSQAKALMALNYKIIMWSVVTYDWDNKISKETCFKNSISKTVSGDIIVFHDSIKASKNMMATLPKTLEYFSKKGFQFKAMQ